MANEDGCDFINGRNANKKLDNFDQNQATTETILKTTSELQNGVNTVYSVLRSGELKIGTGWFYT